MPPDHVGHVGHVSHVARISQSPPEPRSFAALDPLAEPPHLPLSGEVGQVTRTRAALVALGAALGMGALLVAALVTTTGLRVALPTALLIASVVVLRRAQGARSDGSDAGPPRLPHRSGRISVLPRPARHPPRAVRLDGDRLVFDAAQPQTLIDLTVPFGVTLLASPRRDRVVALLSSPAGTYYLGAALDDAARRAFAPLVDRALTVAADDTGLEAIGPDGEPLLFSPERLSALVDALAHESPACLERFVLTDARGASLTLDGRHLSVGDRAVDLTAPLEWRSIVFQESFGHAVAVYQGTWVRQGGTELVLVSLLPQLGPPPGADLDLSQADGGVLRDVRLMQASAEQPPPFEQRVAIERLFMLPLRSALDRAPRAARQPDRAQA